MSSYDSFKCRPGQIEIRSVGGGCVRGCGICQNMNCRGINTATAFDRPTTATSAKLQYIFLFFFFMLFQPKLKDRRVAVLTAD